MRFKIVYKAWWMFWADGMVLWPWVWFRRGPDQVSVRLYRHELEHVYQINRLGRIKFYAQYLWATVRHGYKQNPFEVAARELEDLPLTEVEKMWLKMRRIG